MSLPDVMCQGGSRALPCVNEATEVIWCPTWVSAYLGPHHFCASCAEVFDESKNASAAHGQFFFGERAQQAFDVVEAIIPRRDERYINARGMVQNDKLSSLCGGSYNPNSWSVGLFCVDGKYWLLTDEHITRLGGIDTMRGWFPKILAMPKKG